MKEKKPNQPVKRAWFGLKREKGPMGLKLGLAKKWAEIMGPKNG